MADRRAPPKPQRRTGVRAAAAEATRESILRAAIKVFARYGYAGATVQKISRAAKSVDRMIYYYFGSKEGLFVAALERLYADMDEAEAALTLDESQPLQALVALIRFVLGYYRAHPEFITLLNSENLQRGEHIAKSATARQYSSRALDITARLLAAGEAQGLVRPGLVARDVYLMIAAAGYFHMANRYTLSAFLGERIDTPAAVQAWERHVIDSMLRSVRPDPPAI